ncbi:hypothetical protein N7539_003238 [Penicillium diatomitis]|uniref:C2H2-type domain-containing protein n=1 Tax=Penicillium diatomitis TaxID=2819901 RepID=A0A9W9XGF3_9EURO|nr:uncharacterized protein N7539_003238 [Penicillium diatomitis]KAJ5491671.1 hypothetical protein N7539_003238 [Penicillium diatomitis]
MNLANSLANKQVESYIVERGYFEDQKPESKVAKDHRPLFCFICVGQENLALKKRVQRFSSHGDVSKHIKRKHLRNLVSSSAIACNVCDKTFAEVMNFQRHASDSHSTVTGLLWSTVS